jgi:mRNA interferase RelE/StbE
MFSLAFTKHADKSLQKLESGFSQKIYLSLQKVKSDPFKFIEPLARPKGAEPLYKYRIGEYRVIMAIKNEVMVILVVDIGPRKTIYKKYGGKG